MIAVVERAHHPVEHLGRPVEPQFLAELIRRVEALDESVWLHRRQCHAWRAAPAFQALLKIILGVIGDRGQRRPAEIIDRKRTRLNSRNYCANSMPTFA